MHLLPLRKQKPNGSPRTFRSKHKHGGCAGVVQKSNNGASSRYTTAQRPCYKEPTSNTQRAGGVGSFNPKRCWESNFATPNARWGEVGEKGWRRGQGRAFERPARQLGAFRGLSYCLLLRGAHSFGAI
ncbi:hypothetical protein CDAR_310871 [Caerostris darwini]|uniref:Ribosomal protein L2 n=1 Tax=Caerostris darwini TaxID=1538125 RepID=A0AAV4VR51_9ARAC|nr:hypothetical protein CDAR_310871 [Caerostris darwini]